MCLLVHVFVSVALTSYVFVICFTGRIVWRHLYQKANRQYEAERCEIDGKCFIATHERACQLLWMKHLPPSSNCLIG